MSCEINNKNKSKEICNIIIHFLPEAIERVIQTYREFTSQELSFEAKEFSQHHTACKAAIAHLEGLMKESYLPFANFLQLTAKGKHCQLGEHMLSL